MPAQSQAELEHPRSSLRSPVHDPALRIRVLRTPVEVETVRDIWKRLQTHPEADIDYFLMLLRARPAVDEPFVLALYTGEECKCLLAGRIEGNCLEVSSGYRVLWRARVRQLTLSDAAFMGQMDESTKELVVEHLLRTLRTERIDMVVWHGVRWASHLQKLLRTKPDFWCRDLLVRPTTHWVMRLPGSLESIFKNQLTKKRRYWAKRSIRLLESAFPGQVQYVPLSTSEEVPKLLSEAATIARQGYQWRIGVGFLDSAQQRESIALLASKGMLRAVILYVQGRPVSYWICKQYGRGLHLDYTGYDPSFGRYEPGTLALFWIMDQACQEGLDFIDMGGGQYEYMRKFSNSQFVDCTHLVFAASRRGILLNALRIVTLGPIELIRHMTEVFGMESQVREMWRKYPSQGGQKRKLREIPKPNHQRIVSNLPGQTRRGIPQKLWRWTFLVLLVSVTYLSWKPSPSIAQVSWIPAALGRWFDQHDFSKNVIGYGVFALTGFAAWSRPMHLPADQPSNYLIHSLVLLACFCATVAVLELGQLALSHRTCDWADILAGWTGIVLVWAIFQVGQFIFGGRN